MGISPSDYKKNKRADNLLVSMPEEAEEFGCDVKLEAETQGSGNESNGSLAMLERADDGIDTCLSVCSEVYCDPCAEVCALVQDDG
jgi:hypothetical protein